LAGQRHLQTALTLPGDVYIVGTVLRENEERPMFKKIPGFALWAILALAVALVPLACSSDNSSNDGSSSMSG